MERKEEDGEVGDYVDGGAGDEDGSDVYAGAFDGRIPDSGARHAL